MKKALLLMVVFSNLFACRLYAQYIPNFAAQHSMRFNQQMMMNNMWRNRGEVMNIPHKFMVKFKDSLI